MTRTAIWASPLSWRVPTRVSAHHYATCLAQSGWRVAFLSYPVSPLHLLTTNLRKSSRDRWRTWWRGGECDLAGQLEHYAPCTFLPPCDAPVLRGAWVLDAWRLATLPRLHAWLQRHGYAKPDLLVLDSPAYAFLLDTVRPARSLLRIVDLTAGFQGVTPAMIAREQSLISQVDHVVYTAHSLRQLVMQHGPRAATLVPAGADVEFFRQHPATMPVELHDIPRPRAIYVGAIDHWFDEKLLAQVATACPEISFVVIGPARIALNALKSLRNVRLLGARPYADLPGYLRHADVGIIPFQRNELVDAVCPIKLFEYMACGLPVVSTRWKELEAMTTPAVLCDDAIEFASAVRRATLATENERAGYVTFAQAADWKVRFQRLADAVGIERR